MIDPKKIPSMSYDKLEAALYELSTLRKATHQLGLTIKHRMDELAAEEKAAKLLADMPPAEYDKIKGLIESIHD